MTFREPISYFPALVLYALSAAAGVPAEYAFFSGNMSAALGWLAISVFLLALAYVAWGLLHYSCWRALPERYRATTPGRAVGFMFIPLFNFVWAFISFTKLADGFNAWGADVPGLPIRNMRGLGIAKAITFVCFWTIGWIPGLGSIVALTDVAVFGFYTRGIVFNANLMIPRLGRS